MKQCKQLRKYDKKMLQSVLFLLEDRKFKLSICEPGIMDAIPRKRYKDEIKALKSMLKEVKERRREDEKEGGK